MRRLLATAALALAATLSGCESVEGGIVGVAPASRDLSGKIENGVYTAEDGSFSVTVPHAPDGYEFRYMQVKELAQPGDRYVSFGPAAFCQSIWRLVVTPVADHARLEGVFDEAFEMETKQFREQIEAAGRAPLILDSENREPLDGHAARRRIYTQQVPAGVYASNAPATLTHEVLLLDLQRAVIFVWVQRGEDTPAQAGLGLQAFAESVVLH